MSKDNRLVTYPRMWLVLKLRNEAKKKGCSVSQLISEVLFQYFNKK